MPRQKEKNASLKFNLINITPTSYNKPYMKHKTAIPQRTHASVVRSGVFWRLFNIVAVGRRKRQRLYSDPAGSAFTWCSAMLVLQTATRLLALGS
jgi:hypothetical protein